MAIIKSGILSDIKGSIGNITGRIVNGRNILSKKSGFRKLINTPESILRRDKFRLCVKLGVNANSIPELRLLWRYFAPKGLNYIAHFVQSNYHLSGNGVLTNRNVITPAGGFPVSVATSNIKSNSISIEIDALTGSFNFNLSVETKIKMAVVVYLSNPASDVKEKYAFIPVEFDSQNLQLDNPISFTKSLLRSDQLVFESYYLHKIYAAVITLNANDDPVHYSRTMFI